MRSDPDPDAGKLAALQVTAVVRTVLGDVPAAGLGVVDSHDHLFLATPALPGDELGAGAADDLRAFVAAGGRTLVQWTPRGMRRGLDQLPELARAAGGLVVAATGRHRARHYASGHAVGSAGLDALAAAFVDDVENRGCGLIKIGVADPSDAFERTSLAAAAVAHTHTGAPVAIHLEEGRGGQAVLDALGIDPEAVVLGHVGRNPDLDEGVRLAARGAFVCLDGPRPGSDWTVLPTLDRIAAAGHLDRVLLGADTTSRAGVGSAAGLLHLVAARLDASTARAVTVANPARAWRLRA